MKKILLLIGILQSVLTFAQQNNGITYQAVIYSTTGESIPGIKNPNSPLANKEICLQFSIIDGSTQTEYQEKITTTTDLFGMVNLVIGNGTQTGGYAGSFISVDWSDSPKYLKVSLDQSGNCTAFEEISNQVLNYVPFALAAKSAASVTGIVGITNGGTNATTVLGAKTNLQLENIDNTSDLNKPLSTATQNALNSKVDKVAGKDLSTEDYTTEEKTKLASLNTPDLSGFATLTNLETKVDKVAGKDLSTEDFTTAEKTKLASLGGTPDLSSYATNTNLALKANSISPALTGIPTTPTASANNNSTQIANTAFVNNAIIGKFVDLTTNQTVAGKKTFNSDISVNGLTIGKGTGQNDQNTAIGAGALNSSNVNGTRNTAVGALALTNYAGTSFDNNTGVGYFNMIGLTTGYGNTSIGAETMFNVGSASNNTGIGNQSLINTSGNNNVGVGARSGDGLTTGSNNTFLGTQARTNSNTSTISNATAIGSEAIVTTSNTIQLGNSSVTDVKTNAVITSAGFKIPSGTSSQYLMADGSVSTGSSGSSSAAVDLTTDQTISGVKTFGSNLIVNGMTVGSTSNSMMMGRPYSNTLFGYDVTTGNYASESSVFGYKASATGPQSIAIGSEASANQTQGISIGYHSSIGTGYGFAIGSYSQSNGMYSVALGAFSQTSGDYSVALGYQANATAENAIAIGKDATASTANTIQLGNANVTDVKTSGYFNGIGFKTPSGTSSQYLMADGSVSTSTLSNYLPLTGGNIIGAVAIGTSSPQSSAALDVTSTTQGFLPPRMTQDQRNAINNPVAGLVVWCKNCGENGELQVFNGTNWSNLIGGSTLNPLVVGSSYKGGKIAYIFQSGDPGYVAGEFHGIIASNADLSNGIRWGQNNDGLSTTYDCTNRHGSSGYALPCAIGAGRTNTSLIISSNTEVTPTDYAAKICDNYSIVYNGVTYDDWFLPSYNEMLKVYQNKNLIGGLFYDSTNSSSKSNWYWTSTGDVFQDRAADVNSNDGSKARNFRGYLLSVRAVRYF